MSHRLRLSEQATGLHPQVKTKIDETVTQRFSHLDLGTIFSGDSARLILNDAVVLYIEEKCPWIRSVDLSSNNFFDNKIGIISKLINSEKLQLRTILLNDNRFTDYGFNFLIQFTILQHNDLSVLDFRNNCLKDDGCIEVGKYISKNPNTLSLAVLNLSYNPISHKGVKALRRALKCNTSITTLLVDNPTIDSKVEKWAHEKKKLARELETNFTYLLEFYYKAQNEISLAPAEREQLEKCDRQFLSTRLAKPLPVLIETFKRVGLKVNEDDISYISFLDPLNPLGVASVAHLSATSSREENYPANQAGPSNNLAALNRIRTTSQKIEINHSNEQLCDNLQLLRQLRSTLLTFSHLERLDLSQNYISGFCHEMDSLAIKISKHPTLKLVNLDSNRFGNNPNDMTTARILKSTCLEELSLRDNGIEALFVNQFRINLGLNQHLKRLDLGNNNIGDEGIRVICLALENNTGLESLKVDNCGISRIGCSPLKRLLLTRTHLKHLGFEGNRITTDQLLHYLALSGSEFYLSTVDGEPFVLPELPSDPMSPEATRDLDTPVRSVIEQFREMLGDSFEEINTTSSSSSSNTDSPGQSTGTNQPEVSATNSSRSVEVLPENWEARVDPASGVTYYVNHVTRTTQWERPRLDGTSPSRAGSTTSSASVGARGSQANVQTSARRSNSQQSTGSTGRRYHNQRTDEQDQALPFGWEMRRDLRSGIPYYVNHSTRTTQWERPALETNSKDRNAEASGSNTDDALPPGWERRKAPSGHFFYVNHNNKTTHWEKPTIETTTKSQNNPAFIKKTYTLTHASPHYRREFQSKITRLRCHQWKQTNGETTLEITRENIFEDAYQQIFMASVKDLKKRVKFQIKGEEGLDYGGLSRECFLLLSNEFSNPNYGLFKYANDNHTSLTINPHSGINEDHLKYFKFIGRAIGIAVFHGHFITAGFTLPFYKNLLQIKLSLDDLNSIDPEQYNSLKWILDNDIDDLYLGLNFTIDYDVFGVTHTHELKENGAEIDVTDSNKHEFVNLMIAWKVVDQVRDQADALFTGFSELITLDSISVFDEKELEMLICGTSEINVADWQKNSVYRNYTPTDQPVIWFWEIVREMNHEQQSRLLQFVTGTCRVPLAGFAELQGSNGKKPFCIEKIGNQDWLPHSHTCFNRIDLPPYKNKEQMRGKIFMAIQETEGFGAE